MPRKEQHNNNKKVNNKHYESMKTSKRQHFPHRRKFVRRPSDHDVSEKRQTTLVTGKMRRTNTVEDSDEDEDNMEIEEDLERNSHVNGQTRNQSKAAVNGSSVTAKEKKRVSDATEQGYEATRQTKKRSRTQDRTRTATSTGFENESKAVHDDDDDRLSPSDSELKGNKKRRRTRQSTMTQILDGRRLAPDTPEPEYKPVRKGSRRSWSGKNTKKGDKNQRTLTQMVPELSFHALADDDTDEEEDQGAAERSNEELFNNALTQRLVEKGLFKPANDMSTDSNTPSKVTRSMEALEHKHDNIGRQGTKPVVSAPDNDEAQNTTQLGEEGSYPFDGFGDEDSEDEYQPTQFIEAPAIRHHTRVSRRRGKSPLLTSAPANSRSDRKESAPRSTKSRFSLLSTPEKRRVREIPSSQSPAESRLSTQNTPQKSGRTPLDKRSVNGLNCAETPTKRKQVNFQVPDKEEIIPARPRLSRFASTIQDSEDEDEEIVESDHERGIGSQGAHKEFSPEKVRKSSASFVGLETQAVLHLIDEACANEEMKRKGTARESSEKLGGPMVKVGSVYQQGVAGNPKSEVQKEIGNTGPTSQDPTSLHDSHTTPPRNLRELQDTYPSSPLILMSDGSDEGEQELSLTPSIMSKGNSREHTPSPLPKTVQTSKDVHIVAPASSETLPSGSKQEHGDISIEAEVEEVDEDKEESQLSNLHSAAAEEQLHSEYATYSQFRPPGPPASSMQVAHDARFSYQDTPRPRVKPQGPHQTQHSSSNHSHSYNSISQATTVDEHTQTQDLAPVLVNCTPEKQSKSTLRTLTLASKTPKSRKRRAGQDSPVAATSSPTQPPPLFIPSSFPSPSKVLTQYQPSSPTHRADESWTYHNDDDNSSPLVHMTRGDGVGASGVGKGYTQWLSIMGPDKTFDGKENVDEKEGEEEEEMESWEDFSIPAFPPPMTMEDEGEMEL